MFIFTHRLCSVDEGWAPTVLCNMKHTTVLTWVWNESAGDGGRKSTWASTLKNSWQSRSKNNRSLNYSPLTWRILGMPLILLFFEMINPLRMLIMHCGFMVIFFPFLTFLRNCIVLLMDWKMSHVRNCSAFALMAVEGNSLWQMSGYVRCETRQCQPQKGFVTCFYPYQKPFTQQRQIALKCFP